MAISGQDIGLLFGVLGGGRISGESGSLIRSQLDSIVASLNNETNSKRRRIKLSLDVAGTKRDFTAGLRQVTNSLSGQKQFKIKVSEIDANSAINKLKSQLDAMLRTIKVDTGFSVTIGKNGASSAMKEIANDAKGAVLSISQAEAALKEIAATNQSLTAGYKKVKVALGGEAATGENLAAVEQLKQKYIELQTVTNTLNASKRQLTQDEVNQIYIVQAALQQLIALTMERINAENAVADAAKRRAAAEVSAAEKEKAASMDVISMRKEAIALQKRMASALNNFSKASGTPWYQSISAGKAELDAMLSGAVALDRTRLNNLIDSFNASEGAIRGAGLATKSFGDTIASNAKKFASWLGVSQVIMRIIRLIGDMVNAVKEIDAAMTELRKVTNETEITYTRFLENAAKRAKALGATLSDTVNASADFARLGYSLTESAELADAALVYKNVGDGIEDISTASESIISTMRGFNIEAEQAMFIVDKFNEVGNNFAISSKGVGDALLRSASALAAGNNTLDESIGLITAANSVVQDADKVGTTLKTISMYLRAAKTEAEEAGESTEGMAESVSELRAELLSLTGGKVDIQLDEDTFKSTYQIIKELSQVWGELTDISQANILEMIGGKRNSNVVAALLTNFEMAEDVVKTSAEAAGSALAENEKYLDSIAGKISVFSATFEEMSTHVFESELVKDVVDLGTALVSVAGGLAKVDMLLPSILAAVVTYKSFKMAQNIAQLAAQEEAAVASLVSRLLAEKATNDNLIVSYQTLSAAQQSAVLTKLQMAVASGQLTQETYKQIVANLSLATATTGAKAATDSLNISIKSLLASNPIGWIMLAISLIPTVINLISSLHKSNEELIQDGEDLKNTYSSSFSEVKSDLETLRGLEDEFYRLSDGVDTYGNNISLAADDYARYQEIVSTIVGISPALVSGYDAEGNAIANKNGLLEKSIELMEEEQRLKMKEFISDDNLTTIGMGEVASIKEFQSGKINPGYGTYIEDGLRFDLGRAIQDASDSNTDVDEYDIFSAFGLEDKWSDYLYASSNRMQNLVSDYYDDIAETILTNRDALKDVFSESELDAFSEMITEHQKNVDLYEKELDQKQSALNPTLQYIPQTITAYRELTDGQKEFLTQYINNFRITADTTEEDILQMKQDILDFTEFVAGNEDLKQTIDLGLSIKYGVDEEGESLSVSDYKDRLKELEDQISSYDDEVQVQIKAALGIETDVSELNEDVDKAITHVKNLLKDEFDDEVDNLSVSEVLQIYYNISADPNSMTFEELETEIERLGTDWSKTVNVLDFSTMVDGLSEIESGVGNLVSAMDSLREGTKLTKGELAKLALEYPELLKVSDLFTDTSIENQQSMLDAVLDTYEKEHDALIDTKIAELTATNQLIQDQIALENEKKNKVVEIADLQANGKLDSERSYQELLDELRDLEGQNYVTFSDGILSVNQDMLTKELEQTGEKVEDTRPLFEAQGNLIAEANFKGTSEGLKAFPQYASKLATWAGTSFKTILSNIGTNIGKAFSGDTDFIGVFSGVNDIGSVLTNTITLETQIEGNYTIDEKSIDEWSAEYQEVIQKRVDTLTEQIESNNTIIDNLSKLKGLDLSTIYGSDSSGSGGGKSGSNETEEYIADIERYREALERLNQIRIHKNDLEMQLSNTDDLDEQIRLEKELLNVYQGEQDILEEINALRDETISNGVTALEQLGFQIDYDPDNNKFFVKNLEHLNELTASSVGDYENLQEATNALRKDTEDLINTLEDLNKENQDDKDTWQELDSTIREAKINIVNNLKEIVSQASEAVDSIQNVYDTLKAAADEYAANGGFISVDAFQKIVDLGPEYMQYLRDENGLLVINEQAINRVIAAKTEQLALENAMSYIERIRLALQGNSIESLNTLLFATTEATDATWGLVYAELALMHQMGDLNDSQYEAAMHNINAIRALADNAISGIGRVSNTVEEDLTEMKSGLDDILKYVMDMLRHRIEQQIDALEEMKEAYGELIELKKESMDAAKEETDYQDEVADKVKEIAKLQERINALSLDDSRDAQAQKAKLQEEMAKLQEELADTQAEHAIDSQKDSLDKMQEAYEKEKDEEIDILEQSISSEQKLYEMAISYIKSNWDTLYQELIAWNTEYGSVLNSEITTAWDNCLAAAQRYGSYVNALNSIDADIENSSNGSNNIVGDSGKYDPSSSKEESIHAIIKEMYSNSRRHGSEDAAGKEYLNKRNLALGAQLAQYGITAVRGSDGVWYVDRVGGQKLYEKYKNYIYHTGGIVGDEGSLKENELLAKIEKGEVMVSNRGKGTLFSLIEFVDMLNKRLDTADISNVTRPGIGDVRPDLSNITNNQSETIHFGDVYIYGADETTVEKHREVNREFANEVLKQLNIKR